MAFVGNTMQGLQQQMQQMQQQTQLLSTPMKTLSATKSAVITNFREDVGSAKSAAAAAPAKEDEKKEEETACITCAADKERKRKKPKEDPALEKLRKDNPMLAAQLEMQRMAEVTQASTSIMRHLDEAATTTIPNVR